MTEMEIQGKVERFIALCRSRGFSVTPQRLALYRELASATHHPSPEMLYERVREQMPTLSLATVYKAVDTFKELGLIQPVNPLHERMRLDANMQPHHHLVCVRCQSVVDIHHDALESVELPEEHRRGFQVYEQAVQFNGVCETCQDTH